MNVTTVNIKTSQLFLFNHVFTHLITFTLSVYMYLYVSTLDCLKKTSSKMNVVIDEDNS